MGSEMPGVPGPGPGPGLRLRRSTGASESSQVTRELGALHKVYRYCEFVVKCRGNHDVGSGKGLGSILLLPWF